MINILVAKDERKVKKILSALLKEDYAKSAVTFKEKLIELEESLYNKKKGALYKAMLDEIEKPMIEYAIKRAEGNQLKASRVLGLNRNTVRAKIKKWHIDPDKYKESQ